LILFSLEDRWLEKVVTLYLSQGKVVLALVFFFLTPHYRIMPPLRLQLCTKRAIRQIKRMASRTHTGKIICYRVGGRCVARS
jgi:hypothetical protein